MIFDILWIFDLALTAIIGYFFIAGLVRGAVSNFNAGIWFVVIAAVSAILVSAQVLHNAGYVGWACVPLLLLAAPGALYGLFLLAVIVSGAKWN